MIVVAHMSADVKRETDLLVVNCCINNPSSDLSGLSPFVLGPCDLYGRHRAMRMENAWQFCKVYPAHADRDGNPGGYYWSWAERGWNDMRAHRYPMGRGTKPLYSLWDGEHLGYIEARKRIYVPLYAKLVVQTTAYRKLQLLHEGGDGLILLDWDGRHDPRPFSEILNDSTQIMGHAFVLKALLENDSVLAELL